MFESAIITKTETGTRTRTASRTETGERALCDRLMSHLAEADHLLEMVQTGAMARWGFAAIRDPADPIHHLDEVLLAIGDARSAVIAYLDRHPVR